MPRARVHQATGWLADRFSQILSTEDRVVASLAVELLADGISPAGVLRKVAAGSDGQAMAVLLDEAHHLASWPVEELTELRDFLHHDRRIGVIVSSSERSAMAELYQDGGPLQYVGEYLELDAIALDDWRRELPGRFERIGSSIASDALELLLDQTRGHPGCTMLLARACARVAASWSVTTATVNLVLPEVSKDEMWRLLERYENDEPS